MRWLRFWSQRGWLVFGLCIGLLSPGVLAAPAGAEVPVVDTRSLLLRMHAAATGRNYQGTMVFTTGSVISSSRVAHYCVGDQVFERIEMLDGKQRQIYRHNDLVHTLWSQSGTLVVERRWLQLSLPSSTQSVDPRAVEQYEPRHEGRDRIAGREAWVLLLQPRDEHRYAQRIWADLSTGLMLRADVLGSDHAVLESSAFSDVEVDVAPQPASVLDPIRRAEGQRVLRPTLTSTTLESEGWVLARPLPGFHLTACIRRPAWVRGADPQAGPAPEVVQAVYSDGLVHVSLFIEAYDGARHRRPITARFGATHSVALRRGEQWITAMGDVPPATLKILIDALERRP